LKLVFIVAKLVKEANDVPNKDLEDEILKELKTTVIPYVETIEKVTVLVG